MPHEGCSKLLLSNPKSWRSVMDQGEASSLLLANKRMGATTVLFPVLFPVLLALVLDRGRLPAAVVIADAASAPGRLGAPRGSAPDSPSVFGIVVVVGVLNYKEETTWLVGKEEMDSNQHSIVLDSLC
jgi:hypothetical protein